MEASEIEQETAIVDAFTQWLIGQPEHYDVCVTTNMFGDIVTEMQRSVGFFHSLYKKATVEKVLLLGNTSKLPGLTQYLGI